MKYVTQRLISIHFKLDIWCQSGAYLTYHLVQQTSVICCVYLHDLLLTFLSRQTPNKTYTPSYGFGDKVAQWIGVGCAAAGLVVTSRNAPAHKHKLVMWCFDRRDSSSRSRIAVHCIKQLYIYDPKTTSVRLVVEAELTDIGLRLMANAKSFWATASAVEITDPQNEVLVSILLLLHDTCC